MASKLLLAVLALVLTPVGVRAAGEPPAAPPSAINPLASGARPMPWKEVVKVYADKTWVWSDGAAYFDGPRHRFLAWSGEGANASYSSGDWAVPRTGRMCFNATWHSVKGVASSRTCFDHATDGKRIFQRRLPNGAWYVFANDPPEATDEASRFKPGNLVAESVERNRKLLGRPPR